MCWVLFTHFPFSFQIKPMSGSVLNKRLFTDINRLKLCNKTDSPVRFSVDKSPFNDDGEQEETGSSDNPKEILIIGRIYPNSEIFREGAFQIEMKLTNTYPLDPPEVRFITPIYHPNVGKDGKVELIILL
jgi:ubiquitin-protein ligase